MGSRLRENPTKFIECWCEIVGPQGNENPPWIIQKFPRSYAEEDIIKSIPQFTFPCTFEKSSVQHFSFVLTNLQSKFLYGFCRHAPDTETAIVILSHLPWHELFYKLLNHCSAFIANKNSGDLWSFLQCLYQVSVPAPGTKLTVTYGDNKCFVAECPNHLNLPSIPENRNLSEYFSAIDVDNMMLVFASMLSERRIIVTSERVSRLSACVQAANNLIYPMSWQHIFIPVLPQHLIDYLNAPMPFLIGVSWSMMQNVRMDELGDVVILNADTNNLTSPYEDLLTLPEEVTSSLRKNLNASNGLIGDGVARAFLKALVQLIGNYREALQFRDEDRRISFNEAKFVAQRPNHFQPFVEKMLELQIFRQFIEERVDLLNSGLHTSDEFELEASVYGEKSSSKMKQILSNVKKESGAIMKNVKNKTNPAMKSAVKTVAKSGKNVRQKGKITYKGIRGKLKDIQQPQSKTLKEDSISNHVNGDTKPRSVPSSPTHILGKRSNSFYSTGIHDDKDLRVKATYKRSSQSSKSVSYSDNKNSHLHRSTEDLQKTPSPQEIDLIGEMEDVFKSHMTFKDSSPHKRTSTSSLSSSGLHQETNSTISMSSSIISSTNVDSIYNPFGDTIPFGEHSVSAFNGNEALTTSQDLLGYTNSKRAKSLAVLQNLNLTAFAGSTVYRSVGIFPNRPLSASLTSLDIDLSLDIPLPPPLFPDISSSLPPGPSSLPPSLAEPPLPTPRYRSLKILPEPDFFSDPSNRSRTLPPGAMMVPRIIDPPVARPRRRTLPKYDVSPTFSASLARFSSRGSNANYFFSFLSKPKSTDSLLDFDSSLNDSVGDVNLSSPLPCAANTPVCANIMSTSLPPSYGPLKPSLPPAITPPPRSRRRRTMDPKKDSSQDLLLLESPREEEFDPLYTKEIPPHVPARQLKHLEPLPVAPALPSRNSFASKSAFLDRPSSVTAPPRRLSPTRYLPFNSLQQNRASLASNLVQNPMYTQHDLNSINMNAATSSASEIPYLSIEPLIPQRNIHGSGKPQMPLHGKPIGSSGANTAASFAASMLSATSNSNSVNLNLSHPDKVSSTKEKDLLGDFSSGFKILTAVPSTKDRNVNT